MLTIRVNRDVPDYLVCPEEGAFIPTLNMKDENRTHDLYRLSTLNYLFQAVIIEINNRKSAKFFRVYPPDFYRGEDERVIIFDSWYGSIKEIVCSDIRKVQ